MKTKFAIIITIAFLLVLIGAILLDLTKMPITSVVVMMFGGLVFLLAPLIDEHTNER